MTEPTVAALSGGDFARLEEHYTNGEVGLVKGTVLHLHAVLPDRIMACIEDVPENIREQPGFEAKKALTQGVVYLTLPSAKLQKVRRIERWEAC